MLANEFTIEKDKIFEVRVYGVPKFNINTMGDMLYRITYFNEDFRKDMTEEFYILDRTFTPRGEYLTLKDSGSGWFSKFLPEGKTNMPVDLITKIEPVL